MYEGWHIEFSKHAIRRMSERMVDEHDVRQVIAAPDATEPNQSYGGILVSRYLADWDRILVVAVEERPIESVILVKTVLWSAAR